MLSRAKNINSEYEAKFIQDRITSVEKFFAILCHAFGAYSRKAARLRDKGDDISSSIMNFSEMEVINKSLSEHLAKFAGALTLISDYGDKRVQFIDSKVISEFSQYESICKNAREEVKQIFIARDKEVLRKRQLDRVRDRNPRNRQQIVQAETELVQATADVSRTMHNLEEQVTTFERQKLHDIKTILLDFISTEIGYHAKALEHLTEAYKSVHSIDEDGDLEEFQKVVAEMEMDFKKALRLPDTIPHATRRPLFRSSQSLGSLGSIFSTPKKKSPGIPTNSKTKQRRHSKSDNNLNKEKKHSRDLYESADETEEDSESEAASDNAEEDDSDKSDSKHVSPFVAKRYLK